MYLALILGLWALTTPAVAGGGPALRVSPLTQATAAQSEGPSASAQPQTPSAGEAQEPAKPRGQTKPEAAPPPAAPSPGAAPRKRSVPGQTGQPQAQATATRSKAKPGRPKRATASGSISVPEKKVVRNGGAGDPVEQLAPGMSQEQASRQRQSTTELLVATDANLKQISSRRLNPSQQEGVNQIRKYVEQAAQAEKAGDVQRAHNLASKALLLSDDLAKH